ncbi:MAG: nuclear transport factor 2 family protein [Deltaproteobacteria bacterium]|nr:nuclear transport factor 2 family protein [Deltaproteobacteria bacterium]
MTLEELHRLCDAWLETWTGNRPERLLAHYAEDAFYRDPARPEGLRGREALAAYFEKLLAKNPEWRWRRQALFPTESGFILKWVAQLPVGDTALRLEGMDLVELEGEKIRRNEVYFDPTPLRA